MVDKAAEKKAGDWASRGDKDAVVFDPEKKKNGWYNDDMTTEEDSKSKLT